MSKQSKLYFSASIAAVLIFVVCVSLLPDKNIFKWNTTASVIDAVIPQEIQIGEGESGEIIDLAWTDNNDGENLIIQSDKKYYDGNGQTEVYFSVTNATDKDQKADVVFWFEGEDKGLVEVGRMDSEKKIFNSQFPIFNQFSIPKFSNRKDTKNCKTANGFQDTIASGETNFYKAVIKYPADQSQTEFFIEAFGAPSVALAKEGKYIGYGHLDPYLAGGLVGYWSFNGADMNWASTTAEALDRSGNSNNGNVVNGAKPVSGISGQAMQFDGINAAGNYVNCGNNATLSISSSTSFTMSAWVKSSDVNNINIRGIMGKASKSTSGINLVARSGKFAFQTQGPEIQTWSDSNYQLGVWYYVVGVRNNGTNYLYVNGVKQADEDTTDFVDPTSESMRIGRLWMTSDTYTFKGSIDEVRIYNRALSAEEIGELYRSGAKKMQVNAPQTNFMADDGLVGYWSFNGADMNWASTTAEALDRSGNSNNGNVINGAKAASGVSGQALDFDGINDYVVANGVDFTISGITISAWVKYTENLSGQKTILNIDLNGARSVIGTNAGRLAGHTSESGYANARDYGCSFTSNDNNWHHVILSANTAQFAFYVDGIQCTTGIGPRTYASSKTIIGADKVGGVYFDALIDEVRIYNRALSAEEIGELYRAGARKVKY